MFHLGHLFSGHRVLKVKMYSGLFVLNMPLKSIDREDVVESDSGIRQTYANPIHKLYSI